MEFKVGEPVFSKDRSGLFTVTEYDVASDSYVVQASDRLTPPFLAPRGSLEKINSEATDRIRVQTLADAEQRAKEDSEPKPASRYTPEQILVAKARERVIKPLHEADEVTKEDKLHAMTALDVKLTILNELLAKYRRWPSWESLIPGKPGRRKGDTRFDKDIEDIIATAIVEDHTGPGGTVKAVINGVRARCLQRNQKAPADATIRRRYAQISARQALASNKGAKAARDKFDTFDSGVLTTHALQIVHADNSPLDCHAVDPETGEWLGRPNLTIIVDDHTRSFLGFSLSYRYPSRNTLADAMLMAVTPKADLLVEFGLSGSYFWIQYGAGELYRVDGGGDLNAKTVLAALAKHGIEPDNRMRPQSGGEVERGFGKINPLFMQRLKGAIASNRKIARGEDPQSTATYSVTDLFILIITQICIWHETPGDGFTPNQLWIKSFGIQDGVIKAPRIVKDPLQFRIDAMHERYVRVRREGILTLGLLYKVGPYRNKVGARVRIKLDHNNLRRAWVEFEDKWHVIELKNNEGIDKNHPLYVPKTMWEWNIKRNSGLPQGEVTDAGLHMINDQRDLMKSLVTDSERRRLEESAALQERVASTLLPTGLDNATKGAGDKKPEDGAQRQRGPAPPMMGDDDL
jgi:transposase InsO family protein